MHKITGSVMSVFFFMWCLSGFVLMFVGFPHASRQARFENLSFFNLKDFSNTQPLSEETVGRVELEKYNEILIYRIYDGRKKQRIINAITLDTFSLFNKKDAKIIAEHFLDSKVSHIDSSNALDSWIPWTSYKPLLPFYKCYMVDDQHSVIYISAKSGNIVQQTNRKSRWLGRIGAIPHWIYFKQLHTKANLRKQVVLWIGIIGWLACLSGIIVGFFRLKRNEDRQIVGFTIYKKWWYKWHHILGFVFGLLMVSFVLSGVLYATGIPSWMVNKQRGLSPLVQWNKFNVPHRNLTGKQIWDRLPNKEGVRRIGWGNSMNKAIVKVYYSNYKKPLVYFLNGDDLQLVTLTDTEIIQRAQQLFPNVSFQICLQNEYDYYYENQEMFKRPLPIYKLDFKNKFNETLYINPSSGEAVKYLDNNKRTRRWLTRALHKFDFPILYKHDALRKVLLMVVLIGGLVFSISSIVLTQKWIKRVIK